MESQVSPKNIEARVEKMAADNAAKALETPAAPAVTPEPAKPVEPAKPEATKPAEPVKPAEPAKPAEPVKPEAAKPAEPSKPVEKPAEKGKPNDPTELRKWSTKLSQENAELRNEMKSLKTAIEKMSKKPVDYAELAKNPDSLKSHIEAERQEAVKEMTEKYIEARDTAVANETRLIRIEMERDAETYPRFAKLFPLIQNLAGNQDGRVNFNRPPREVLNDLYALADQLSPAEAAAVAAPAAPAAAAAPAAPVVTEEQIQARIDAAVAKAKADAAAGLRDEANGGGIGGLGKGGSRDTKTTTDALKKMPLKDLKALISKE